MHTFRLHLLMPHKFPSANGADTNADANAMSISFSTPELFSSAHVWLIGRSFPFWNPLTRWNVGSGVENVSIFKNRNIRACAPSLFASLASLVLLVSLHLHCVFSVNTSLIELYSLKSRHNFSSKIFTNMRSREVNILKLTYSPKLKIIILLASNMQSREVLKDDGCT